MLILYPNDKTIAFLDGILLYLYQTINSSLFTLVKIEASKESKKDAILQIKSTAFDTILYLGHGTSTSLKMSESELNDREFLSFKEFDVFANKKVLLLSCNSNELLTRTKSYGYIESIGFGDLPTDWHDITSIREVHGHAYSGIDEGVINDFRTCLVEVVKYSIADYITDNLSFKGLYDLLILRINKRISKFSKNDRIKYSILNDILFAMKKDLQYIKNI